ncbi:MAG: NAD(P)-dependent glycerol-3-phosphate dehydrogenase [Bacteroidetes bacterium]|nr:NAD(P)-dependent glycerol-3-phosphate dehydrogenase [Bacteroidota bacterium]
MENMTKKQPTGIIGSGSFGTAIANLLAHNTDVLLYSRNKDLVHKINTRHENFGTSLSERIRATADIQEVAEKCTLIFPMVPSLSFRRMMKDLSPHLHPYHLLVHGTKGFDLRGIEEEDLQSKTITREHISTMSEVILQESVVVRVGCLSGPNLAKEIMEGQATATLVASRYNEIIRKGKKVLQSRHFHVFGSHDLLGAELAGAFKNIFAIGSGILSGLGMGKNIQAMLITRGLTEMIYFGKAMGSSTKAFFGTAGIGDLIATATSSVSRNFTFGYRFSRGEAFEEIENSMPELAEGVRTLKIARQLAKYYNLRVPITEMLFKVVFEGYDINRAIHYLMAYPFDIDVDFI